ncbi:iron-containing alcohol dehydrogenase [Paenibacillus koleovorans]|uniref:iron-containing alcohol dehydrogenase n=1 Tax=Paenibacillus koleovorans TaxID=121608 RepID=UPI000FD7125C|nr:iron-containing alcohol dehydrogenase [Paenibacillus koleovorans]
MGMKPFLFAGTPAIHFGAGQLAKLVQVLPREAKRVLLVMGSFARTNAERWSKLEAELEAAGIALETARIHFEPTVEWVDEVVERYRQMAIDAVIAIGGGSVLDAGKAVSAMLPTEPGDTVLHYLEGQPDFRPHNGNKTFFVAVPTTSGTGSEMTKNAVIAIAGGFKRSIRHDRFIPDAAIVDPLLTISCPLSVKAASGMDALTQLIESYVSINASPFTDALALSGIEAAASSLLPLCTSPAAAEDPELHARLAYASMLSGITLAHAGLGLVHGFAAPLGGSFPIPHGVICGTLIAEATKRNIAALRDNVVSSEQAAIGLAKYAKVGAMLSGQAAMKADIDSSCDRLSAVLEEWTERLQLPRLGEYGVTAANIDPIIAASNNKQSPVTLGPDLMREILLARL